MKTLKISLVATLATILAWRVRLPQRLWPHHPQWMGLLMALLICVLLQVVWSDPGVKENKVEPKN